MCHLHYIKKKSSLTFTNKNTEMCPCIVWQMLAVAKWLSLNTKEISFVYHFTVDLHVQRAKILNSVIQIYHFLRSEQYICHLEAIIILVLDVFVPRISKRNYSYYV